MVAPIRAPRIIVGFFLEPTVAAAFLAMEQMPVLAVSALLLAVAVG